MLPASTAYRGIVCLLMLGLCLGMGEDAFAAKKKKRKKKRWKMDNTMTLLQTVTQGERIPEKVNPGNNVYQLPATVALTEVRPELRFNRGRKMRLTMRPRLQLEQSLRDRTTPEHQQQEGETRAFMNEAFFSWTHNDRWQSNTGLQNFQWGAAELASPSNPIFRDLGLDKNFFFETRGQSMLRVNYSPTGQLSIITILQPVSNGAARERWEGIFEPQGVMKIEYSDETQTNYVGIVGTNRLKDRPQGGLYGNVEIASSFTAYFDASVRAGSRAYYPEFEPGLTPRFAKTKEGDKNLYSTALAGFRYVTESAWDTRIEFINDGQGWTTEDRDNATLILAVAPTKENFEYYTKPGTLLPGTSFGYFSLRIPDWGPENRYAASLRILHSLTDNTQRQTLNIDGSLGDNFNFTLGGNNASGPLDGELTQGYRWSAFIAGGYTW